MPPSFDRTFLWRLSVLTMRLAAVMMIGGRILDAATPAPDEPRLSAAIEQRLAALELATEHAAPTLDPIWRERIMAQSYRHDFLLRVRLPLMTPDELPGAYHVTNPYVTHSLGLPDAMSNEPAVKAAATALAAELRAIQEPATVRARGAVHQLYVDAVKAALAAQVPEDLDASLLQLSPHSSLRLATAQLATPPDWQQADKVRDFVLDWQNCLVSRARGDVMAQDRWADLLGYMQVGQDLAPGELPPEGVIHDKILALKARTAADNSRVETSDLLQRFAGLKSLDELPAFMQAITRPGSNLVYLGGESLPKMLDDYYELKAGHCLPIVNAEQAGAPWNMFGKDPLQEAANDAAGRLWNQILLLNLARRLDVPDHLLPKPNESYEDYLTRYVPQEIHTLDDWQKLRRVLAVGHATMFGLDPPDWHRADLNASETYVLALMNDRAEQWRDAVVYYLRTLRLSAPHLPNADIKERLDELKKLYAADYAAATGLLGQNPQAPDTTGNRPLNPGRGGRRGSGG